MVKIEETDRYRLTLLEGQEEMENCDLVEELKDQPTLRIEGEEIKLIDFIPLMADQDGTPVIYGKLKPENRLVVLAVVDRPPEWIPAIGRIVRAVQAQAHRMGLAFTLINDQVKEMKAKAEEMRTTQRSDPAKARFN